MRFLIFLFVEKDANLNWQMLPEISFYIRLQTIIVPMFLIDIY